MRIFKGKPHMILLKKLVITTYKKSPILSSVCFFCYSSKWSKMECLVFGGDSGDTRRGLVDEVGPFFCKITIFVHQIITFFNIIFRKKQLLLSPLKTVWFEQESHVKLKISKQNQKRKISSFFLFHDKSLKSYTFSKNFSRIAFAQIFLF